MIPLGGKVRLGPGDIVLDDPAFPRNAAEQPPLF